MSKFDLLIAKKRTENKEPERLNVEFTQTFKVVETSLHNVEKKDEISVKNDVFSLISEQKSVKNNENFNVISADEMNISQKLIKNEIISTKKEVINIFDGIIKGNNWFEIHYGNGKIFFAQHSTKENLEMYYKLLNKNYKGTIPKEIKPIKYDYSSNMIKYI